jgi:uracil phosphoribosyltransferase
LSSALPFFFFVSLTVFLLLPSSSFPSWLTAPSQDTFLEICPEATVGKILIQRNEETAQPMLYYSKLPPLQGKAIVVLDPMVATGGSAICALQVLVDNGASQENMFFFNVVSCPEGLTALTAAFPGDPGLLLVTIL